MNDVGGWWETSVRILDKNVHLASPHASFTLRPLALSKNIVLRDDFLKMAGPRHYVAKAVCREMANFSEYERIMQLRGIFHLSHWIKI